MSTRFVLLLLFLCFFIGPYLLLKSFKKKHPLVFEKYKIPFYSVVCLILAGIFGTEGITREVTWRSTLTLASAAFFATSFLFTLRQGPSEEYKFSMKQLMVFMTFFAIALGCRAIFG